MKNLYLRDACILLDKKEISYSNSILRLKEALNICIKHKTNIQITLDKKHYLENYKTINKLILKRLNKIKFITIHLTTSYQNLFSNDIRTMKFTNTLLSLIKSSQKKIVGICIHPDHIDSWKYLKKLSTTSTYLAVEVTDKKAIYGNKISHISKLLKNNNFLKIVIDTSHIKELEKFKIMTFDKFFNKFKEHIVEAQISDFGNFYKTKLVKTTHSLLHLKKDKKIKFQINLLKKINNLNFVIEGLIPFNKNRTQNLLKELNYLKSI